MANGYITKNYAAHGGNEWVIGGKLTFLEGAETEGLEALLPQAEMPYGGRRLLLQIDEGAVVALDGDSQAVHFIHGEFRAGFRIYGGIGFRKLESTFAV